MKKQVSLAIAGAAIVSSLLLAFQNCSSGSLPDVSQSNATSVQAPQQLLPGNYNPSMAAGATQTLSASNPLGTLNFSVVSNGSSVSACTVDPLTGLVTAAAALSSAAICTVQISDTGGRLPAQVMITVSPPASQTPTITAGSQTFDALNAVQFSVPAYNSMTIEVYGGGGGGGGLMYLVGAMASAGGTGGTTSVTGTNVSVTAAGGGGGSPGAVRGNSGAGGAGGAGVGGDTMAAGAAGGSVTGGNAGGPAGGAGGAGQAMGFDYQGLPGSVPGGGGGGRGWTNYEDGVGYSGGGGGGGYAKVTILPANVPAGTVLNISVGAGGAAGLNGSSQSGYAGANGRVIITWN